MEENVLAILNEIANDAGKLYKERVIARHVNDTTFVWVLNLAYNPNIIWYASKLPDKTECTDGVTLTLAQALDQLVYNITSRKITGNQAIQFMSEVGGKVNDDDYEVLKRVINKDLGVGINASTINKAIKRLIPVTPYMGAIVFDEKSVRKLCTGKVEVDVKMDGRYCNVVVLPSGEVDMVSRQGKSSLLNHPKLIQRAAEISSIIFPPSMGGESVVLNGELMMDGVDRYTANGIISSLVSIYEKISDGSITPDEISKKSDEFVASHGMTMDEVSDQIYMTVWDYIPYSLYISGQQFNAWRSIRLNKLIKSGINMTDGVIRLIEHKIVESYEDVMSYFKELLARGEEGAIVKSLTGAWVIGKPTSQVKLKLKIEVDLKIVGFKEGNKKNAGTLGSLYCESSDGVLKVTPTWCDNSLRDEIWNNQDKYINTVVEVSCCGISRDNTGNYSLLHPVATIIRDDKYIADDIEQIEKISNMALGLN